MHRATPSEFPATRDTIFMRLKEDGPARELAWQDFQQRYGPMIGGFARRMGASRDEITDVVQDVVIGFFTVSPLFVYDPACGRFRGYLKTCTWRALRDRLRDRRLPDGRRMADVDPADVQVEAVWDDTWETEALQRAMEVVREQYQRRTDMQRTFQAFEMYVLFERPADEVAAELKMGVEGVHQAKTRISKAIQTAMEAEE